MNRTHAIKTIHACARAAGLDEDGQRDVYERETGQRSLRDMSEPQLQVVARKFQAIAPPRQTGKTWKAAETRPDLRLILKLWWLLADAKVVATNNPDRRAALNAFLRSKTWQRKWGEELTDIRFLTAARAKDVIEALKNIAARNNVRTVR